MGTMVRAVCTCGYEYSFLQGGGFLDFLEVDKEPALCSNCHRLVVVNYISKRPRCPRCRRKIIFYNDLSLCSNKDAPKIQ